MLITFDQAESELDAYFPADSKSSADSGPSTGSLIRSRGRLFWYRSICTRNVQPRSLQSLLSEPQPNTETNAKPNTEANTKPNTDANALQAFSPPRHLVFCENFNQTNTQLQSIWPRFNFPELKQTDLPNNNWEQLSIFGPEMKPSQNKHFPPTVILLLYFVWICSWTLD